MKPAEKRILDEITAGLNAWTDLDFGRAGGPGIFDLGIADLSTFVGGLQNLGVMLRRSLLDADAELRKCWLAPAVYMFREARGGMSADIVAITLARLAAIDLFKTASFPIKE